MKTDEKKGVEVEHGTAKIPLKRLVSKINTAIAMSMFVPKRIIKEMAQREEAVLRGKQVAIICGHPEWKNCCLVCGEAEIGVDERECLSCKVSPRTWPEKKKCTGLTDGVLRTGNIA